jgi:hypothetical protein
MWGGEAVSQELKAGRLDACKDGVFEEVSDVPEDGTAAFRGLGLRFLQDRKDIGLDQDRLQLGAGCDLAQPPAGVYRQSGPPPRRNAR